jgi:hypothetical protein
MQYAVERLEALGYTLIHDENKIAFIYKGSRIEFSLILDGILEKQSRVDVG